VKSLKIEYKKGIILKKTINNIIRSSKKSSILFIWIVGSLNLLNATTYYVDAQNGNDHNNGTTKTTAWKTLTHVGLTESSFTPGDTIAFKKGQTFYGTAYFSDLHGSSDSPIIFTSYGEGAKPILTAIGNLNPHWTNIGNNKWSTNLTGKTERLWKNGIEQKRTSLPKFGHTWEEFGGSFGAVWIWDAKKLYYHSALKPTGKFTMNSKYYVFFFENSSFITVENLDLQGGATASIQIKHSNHLNIRNNTIGKKSGYGLYISNANNLLIERNLIDAEFTLDYTGFSSYKGTDARGVNDGIALWGSVTNSEIRYNDFLNWSHASLAATTTNSTGIAYNKIHHNYFSAKGLAYGRAIGYSGNTHHNELYNNYIENIRTHNQLCGHHNHFHHNTINNVKDTKLKNSQQGNGISLEVYAGNTYENIIEYNTISNTEGSGIVFTASGNANKDISKNTIRNNLFVNCGQTTGKFRSLFVPHYIDIREQYIFDNTFVYTKMSSFKKTIYYRKEYLTPNELNLKNTNRGDKISGNTISSSPTNNSNVGAGKIDLSTIGLGGHDTLKDIENENTNPTNDHDPFIMNKDGLK
jgi:hypothetical protein